MPSGGQPAVAVPDYVKAYFVNLELCDSDPKVINHKYFPVLIIHYMGWIDILIKTPKHQVFFYNAL